MKLGTPVLVGEAAGHFWFPSLHPLGGGNILCEVVLADDRAQGEWPACLCLSSDGGLSWRRAAEIPSYGPVSHLLAPGKLLLLPYEVWPAAPGEKRSAVAQGTLVTLNADGALQTERLPIRFLGFPRDLADYYQGELLLASNGNVVPLADGRLLRTMYGRWAGEERDCNWALTSEDGGITWRYLATVASWRAIPEAAEGANESNTARLADGRLACVFRVGSGQEFWRSLSADDGATWSAPERMRGM